MKITKSFLTFGVTAFLVIGCGGGGGGGTSGPTYNGLTTPAAITSSNSQALASSASNTSGSAITSNNANPFAISISSSSTKFNSLLNNIAHQVSAHFQTTINLPVGATINGSQIGPDFCGGTITYPDNFGSGGMLNGTVTVTNLCYNDGINVFTMSGRIIFSQTSNTDFSIRYSNFSIDSTSGTYTFNMTMTCTSGGCSFSTDFEDADGKTYRIADLTVSGFGTGPYSIGATFYHPDYGYVTIDGFGIMLDCANGHPSAGSINLTGANGSSATITFTSCNGYDGTWNDGISSGTFTGTWL